jgi:hypothetical protein
MQSRDQQENNSRARKDSCSKADQGANNPNNTTSAAGEER